MEVTIERNGKVERQEVKKWVDPYPIDLNTKNEIVRMQKNEDGEDIIYGWFTFEGKSYPMAKVVIMGKPTWFIEGHPLLTFMEYEPTRITVQIKMARGGDWGNGERRKWYQAFVYNVMRVLGCNSFPCFNDRTDDYFNELGMIDCNGMHPHKLIK